MFLYLVTKSVCVCQVIYFFGVKVGKVAFYYYIIYLDTIIPLFSVMEKSVVKKRKVKGAERSLYKYVMLWPKLDTHNHQT